MAPLPDVARDSRTSGGLLAVHPHPDDETLSTGALLATWAASGRPVTVVTCTRGEQGEVIGPGLSHLQGDGPALAAHREIELAAALAALGVRDQLFLDEVADDDGTASPGRYLDSGMAWLGTGRAGSAQTVPDGAFVTVDVDEAAGRLAAVIIDRRPDVVVCDEPGGGYGHPDHVQSHRVGQRAVELAAARPDGFRVPVVLWSVVAADALRAGYEAVAPRASEALSAPRADEPLPSRAVGDDEVDLVVPVGPVLDQVLGAMRAHASQVQAVQEIPGPTGESGTALRGRAVASFALSNAILQPVLSTECYRVSPEWPAGPVRWPTALRARVA